MPWGAAIGAVGAIGAAAINSGNSGGGGGAVSNAPSLAQEQQAVNLIAGVPLPTINQTPYSTYAEPTQYQPVNYNPYLGSATTVALNPTDMAAEQGTLGQLQQFANGEWLPTDQQSLDALQRSNNGAASNAAAQAEQSLESRGEGGGGASTVARMMAEQQAGNADQASGLGLAQAAINRQLAAINGAGSLESTITGQDFTQNTDNANILNQFNSQVQNLKTQAAATAAANTNAASQFNIQNKQAIDTANVNTQNQNLDRTNTLNQTGFNNEMSKATEQANAMFGLATGMDQGQAAAAQNAQAAAAGTRANIALGIQGASAFNGSNTNNGSNGSSSTGSNPNSLPNVVGNWLFPSTNNSSAGQTNSGINTGTGTADTIDTAPNDSGAFTYG